MVGRFVIVGNGAAGFSAAEALRALAVLRGATVGLGAAEAFVKARDEGKIRFVGASVHDATAAIALMLLAKECISGGPRRPRLPALRGDRLLRSYRPFLLALGKPPDARGRARPG